MASSSDSSASLRSNAYHDDEEAQRSRPSTASATRRRDFYRAQRHTARPSTASSSSRGQQQQSSRAPYQEPRDYENLDEQAVRPPVNQSRRKSGLEENLGDDHHASQRSPKQNRHRHHRQHTGGYEGEDDLGEVAAPPPVGGESSAADDFEHRDDGVDSSEDMANSGAATPPFAPRSPRGSGSKIQDLPEVPKWLTEVYTVSYLIFFSFLGTLARLGTQWLTFYPGAPVTTPVIWANFGGSLVMGFLAEDQGLFRDSRRRLDAKNAQTREKQRRKAKDEEEQSGMSKADFAKHKKTIPLYIGLATGFCGSFTSFSSFARDYFLALSNNLPSPIDHPYAAAAVLSTSSTVSRNGGYSFLALVGLIMQTLALSIGGLIIGAQLAVFLEPITPTLPTTFIRRYLDRSAVVLAFGGWLGAVFLAIWPPDRPSGPSSRGSWSNETWRGEVLFALVFAPLGCLLRFYASLKLNGLVPALPLGTFAVNMFGTAVEGMCYDLQHVGVGVMGQIGGGRVSCQVLQGVMDGFCGCLTTVSTWVAEINALQRKHGWAYAFGTLLGGLCLMVVIMGSVRWSVDFSSPVCNTGYPDKIHG